MQVSGRRGTASDVRAVLAAGADPNARDVSGWTALMYAMLNRDPEVIKALLEGGADPNARSRLGESVLMGILSQQAVSSDGAVSKVRLLVAAGANVNEQDQDGNTALMLAFRRPRNPDPETLRQLLQDSGIEVPPNFR
jgi:ankyrin repeat protein